MEVDTICRMGSKTNNPCPNPATTTDHAGIAICAPHAEVLELGRVADGYHMAEEILDEGIRKLEEVGSFGESGIPLLERAREEARQEIARLKRGRPTPSTREARHSHLLPGRAQSWAPVFL